jgi:hypothetical protein
VNRGAVAIVDALGFKGIWGNAMKPSTSVLSTLKTIGAAARSAAAASEATNLGRKTLPPELAMILKQPFVRVVQLSDTIVVAAGRRERVRRPWQRHTKQWMEKYELTPTGLEELVDRFLLFLVCECVCLTLKAAALCEPSLSYRGAVSVGKFAIDETFLLGPAVDEAAELMDLADGPFVWLAPTAFQLGSLGGSTGADWEKLALKYAVPLKEGRRLQSRVLNPFYSCSKEERSTAEKNLLARLNGTRVDVLVKRHNAREFFGKIRAKERLAEFAKASAKRAAAPSEK